MPQRIVPPAPGRPLRALLPLALLIALVAALPGGARGQAAVGPDLTITIGSAPNPLRPGEPLTYTLTVENAGDSPALGARVLDRLPDAVLQASWSCVVNGTGGCARNGGAGNWIDTTVNLGPGASATYTISGLLSQSASGSLQNIASVRPPAGVADPDERNNIARSVTPVAPAADLELASALLTPPDQVVAGGLVDLLVELRNRGPARAEGVAVAQRLPAGLSFVSARLSKGAYLPDGPGWQLGPMEPGEAARLVVRARWSGAALVSGAQLAATSLPDPDSAPANDDPAEDDYAAVRLPLQLADLELALAAAAPLRDVGANAVLTLSLANRGPAAASGVRVSAPLPAGLAFASGAASQGDYDPVSGEWLVGALAPDELATLTLAATLLDPGPFATLAEVAAAEQADPDSRPGNGDPTEDNQAGATVAGRLADLSLSQSVDSVAPAPGGRVLITLRVANAGPSPASGVAVSDRLPLGLSFAGAEASQGDYDPASGEWAVGALVAGGSATLQLAADYAGGAMTNRAEVSAAGQPDPDSRPANGQPDEDDQADLALGGGRADLELRTTVSDPGPAVGGQITLTVAVENKGPGGASGVQIGELLPAGLAYVSDSAGQGSYSPASGRWIVGELAAGATAQLQLRARVAGPGPFAVAPEVAEADQPDSDSTPNNGADGEDDRSAVAVGPVQADLSVSAGAEPLVVPALRELTYRVGVRNDGHSPASGVTLVDRPPPGVLRLIAEPSQGSYDLEAGRWSVGELAPGQSASMELRVRVSGEGPFPLVAEVAGADQPDPDSAPGNGAPGEDDQAAATAFGADPEGELIDLALEQRAMGVAWLPGGVAYVIELTNGGATAATSVEVRDRLPPGARFLGAAPSQGRYDAARGAWEVGRLAAGAGATLTILALREGEPPVTNLAEVSRADQPDADSAPNNGQPGEDDQASVTGLTPLQLNALDALRGPPSRVRLVWETGFEQELAGFHVFRSADGNREGALRLTDAPIAAQGGPREGATYELFDTDLNPFESYSYWLVALGDTEPEFGPVVTPGLEVAMRLYLPALRR